ncbi:unnamed protein product [Vitrella brassicaformis CCMP3155]|uniref:TLDc domain-containing protein n=1 Tax=Vitrella brassicaformis (strain CCMP3155) TaxID=1169540 RepID=A0A0G4GML4_VITBC|nr:unnamed protein product [Vitrella brassicaformis CCMP3155]|eukprot:CEM31426.1 unnamed protein product [Vitrella brassicaformis CCMP3155]
MRSHYVPASYRGPTNQHGDALFGGSELFTADEVEVLHADGVSSISSQRCEQPAVTELPGPSLPALSALRIALLAVNPFLPRLAFLRGSSLSAGDLRQLIGWFAKGREISLVYSTSRHGFYFVDLLAKVIGVWPIVLVIRKGTYLFGYFVGAGIQEPNYLDVVHHYECKVVAFSLAGHFDKRTRVDLLTQLQFVSVAGRKLAPPCPRLTIGDLSFGHDMRFCRHLTHCRNLIQSREVVSNEVVKVDCLEVWTFSLGKGRERSCDFLL